MNSALNTISIEIKERI